MTAELDHIVLGAKDLDSGTAWVEDMLGRPAQGGGAHLTMGTHNRVWSLGNSYLELIAIDPRARAPEHQRWFGLDRPEVQDSLRSGPRLLTWAVRVDDLAAAVSASPVKLGVVQEMSRGDLHWKVALPEDGIPPHQGHIPLCIEWLSRHPAARMDDSGLRLSRLILRRSETALIEGALDAIGAGGLATLEAGHLETGLMAEIATDDGNISFVG